MSRPYVLVIAGATGTGKSDLAIALAKKIDGEIINADIGSFYKPLTIGTAKPDLQATDVVHHLVDILDDPQYYSVVDFRSAVKSLCEQIWKRGKVPIVVGGSGFYIKSFFYRQHEVQTSQEYVQELMQGSLSDDQLWAQLEQIDPIRAEQIACRDRYRIVRALAIFQAAGIRPSTFKPIFDPIASYVYVQCMRPRQELYERIDRRVIHMLERGWLDEVAALQGTAWSEFLQQKKIIGYDDLLRGLQQQLAVVDLIPLIQQKTRNYAKRQLTYFKKLYQELLSEKLPVGIVGDCVIVAMENFDQEAFVKYLLLFAVARDLKVD